MKNIFKTSLIAILAITLTACGTSADQSAEVSTPTISIVSNETNSSPSSLTEPAPTVETTPSAGTSVPDEEVTPVPTDIPADVTPDVPADVPANVPTSVPTETEPTKSVGIYDWYISQRDNNTTPSPTATPSSPTGTEPTKSGGIYDWYISQRDSNAAPATTPSAENTTITADSVIAVNIASYYDFTDAMKTGCGVVEEDSELACFPYEGSYGIDAYVVGTTLYAKAYSNLDYKPEIESAVLKTNTSATYNVDGLNYDTYISINLSAYSKACTLTTVFDCNGYDVSNNTYAYVNSSEVWLCKKSYHSADDIIASRDKVNIITTDLNITPENSVSLDEIIYPVSDYNSRFRCDTDIWAELSHEIITDNSWSDEYKVYLIHEWITHNLAYDEYIYHRADYYQVYDGTWSIYDTHAGVCCDFSHAMLIMCREQNIPCITVETTVETDEPHMLVAIWLDNEWQMVDITVDVRRRVNSYDTSIVTNPNMHAYSALADTSSYEFTTINAHLATQEMVWGSGINYGWYYDN